MQEADSRRQPDAAAAQDRPIRTHPRCQTRTLAADIITPSGLTMHAVSRDVSAFGASFFITENAEALDGLVVGDRVTVNTSTARDLPGEINSIRQAGEDDSRPLIGVKLLEGKQWLGGDAELDELLLAEVAD